MKNYRVKTENATTHKLEKSIFGLFYIPVQTFKTFSAANTKCRTLNCKKHA